MIPIEKMWLSVVYAVIDNDTRHQSGQNLLWTLSASLVGVSSQQISTTVMTRIVVDKCTGHSEQHSGLFVFLTQYQRQRKRFFFLS